MTLKELEKEVEKLKERNKKVESDKAWEISYLRRILIAIFTYLAIGVYLNFIGVSESWYNAIVPTIGFSLSTLTLPYFKKLWVKYFYKARVA